MTGPTETWPNSAEIFVNTTKDVYLNYNLRCIIFSNFVTVYLILFKNLQEHKTGCLYKNNLLINICLWIEK